jgi:molecular chaperone GrpE (heat shock protein)
MVAASPTVRRIDTNTAKGFHMSSDDAGWQAKCQQMADELGAQRAAERREIEKFELQRALFREDETLTSKLVALHLTLERWADDFDDHDTSAERGVIEAHTKAEQRLITALLDVIDYLPQMMTPDDRQLHAALRDGGAE